MVDVPAVTPVIAPVAASAVATEGVLLPHVPPGVASVSVTVEPGHTCKLPPIADGSGSTVRIAVLMQPVAVIV